LFLPTGFMSEVHFIRYEYSYSCLLMGSICLKNFSLTFRSKRVLIFFSEMSLLKAKFDWVLF
jgi:hypothetical protein